MSVVFNPFSGSLEIKSPPNILPNNSRINGVEHFYQSTKPRQEVMVQR